MKISAPHIANLFRYASYSGVKEDELRNFLTHDKLDVCNVNNTVSESEFLNVFKALMVCTKDNYFGLHYGCNLNIKALGFITQLSLNASSIEQAVYILQNYFKESFPLVSLDGKTIKDKYVLKLETTIQDIDLKNQLLDTVYCFLYRELKLMATNEMLPVLKLPYSNCAEHLKFLDARIEKGKEHSFVFDATILDSKINRKTFNEIELLLPKFLQMLDKKKSGYGPFSIQVRNLVLNMCRPELPTFEQVAVHFPLSNRTIQRKLTEEGLSFRKITDDIKSELARYLSKGNKMKTQDIAFILGYAEPSAYLHAVKKWKTKSITGLNV